MRLATFNVENMFDRAKALNLATWAEGKPILEDFNRLTTLIQEPHYTQDIKAELREIMKRHRGLLTNRESKFIYLRDIRGQFLFRPKNKPVEIKADGRGDWIGWFELKVEPVKAAVTENTARIVDILQPDVLCVVEAEDRITLKRFNQDAMPKVGATPFHHVMLIDGNDDRGIDVGLMTGAGFEIVGMRSHVDDTDAKGTIFSRDCAEYEVSTASGNSLLLLINHFKSKGYGKYAKSADKRLRQAKRVREICDARLADGFDYLAVAGDLNEVPNGFPLDPLLRDGSQLTDIMAHPKFVGDGRPGTQGNGTKSAKLDYLLLSPKLAAKVVEGGIERQGVWGGKHGTLFPHLPTMRRKTDAASDHAALWVKVAI